MVITLQVIFSLMNVACIMVGAAGAAAVTAFLRTAVEMAAVAVLVVMITTVKVAQLMTQVGVRLKVTAQEKAQFVVIALTRHFYEELIRSGQRLPTERR